MVFSVRRPLRQNISAERTAHASSVHRTFMAEVGGSRRWWREKSERRGPLVPVWFVPVTVSESASMRMPYLRRRPMLPTDVAHTLPMHGRDHHPRARRSGRHACDRAPFTQSCSRLRRCSHRDRMRGVSFAGSAKLPARDPAVPAGVVPGRRRPRRRIPQALLHLLHSRSTSLADSGLTPAWTITTSHPGVARTFTLGRVRVQADLERGLAMNGTSASNWPP
jgi:hypothetical protein